MIDPQKSLAIFTYPRSGSTWFQDKLNHFNLQEMMNYNVKFKFTRDWLEFDRAYWIERPPLDQTLKYRVEMLKFYHRNHAPVSLKIQTRYMKPEIASALKELDFQYIALERRDRLATVLSFLIVVYTDEWGGKTTPHEITIQRNMFDYVMEVLMGFEYQLEELRKEFPIKTIYFEDALSWEACDWWKPDSNITVQNAKSITTITNRQQVDEWIKECGYI
jgi:hypothetical protein